MKLRCTRLGGISALLALGLLCSCAPLPVDESATDDPSSTPDAVPVAPEDPISFEPWSCRNDLEVQCSDGTCSATSGDDMTPMSVSLEATGQLSACAYSGCWEGAAVVSEQGDFMIAFGDDFVFSSPAASSPATDGSDAEPSSEDVVLVIDRGDGVATLKVGGFALPLHCQSP